MLNYSEGALRCRYNLHGKPLQELTFSAKQTSPQHSSFAPEAPQQLSVLLITFCTSPWKTTRWAPPSLSYSCYRHPRLASVTCQDLTLTQNQGASPRELLLEACRRNNTNLLAELLARFPTPDKIAHLLNTSTDGVGNYCLHVAAAHGACT